VIEQTVQGMNRPWYE